MASDFSFISVAWPWSAKIAVAFVQLDGPFYEEKRKGVTPDGRQTLVWDSVAAERRIARACDILDLIAHSARRPELVVFPEYSLPLTEEGIARLQAKAREHGQVIAAGADNLTDGAYAECLIFGANATAHKVRKHGPSQWEQTMERADASAPIPVFTWTHQGKSYVLIVRICLDFLSFPHLKAEQLPGPGLLVVPMHSPTLRQFLARADLLLREPSLHGLGFVFCNATGFGGSGASMVFSAAGTVQLPANQEGYAIVEFDLDELRPITRPTPLVTPRGVGSAWGYTITDQAPAVVTAPLVLSELPISGSPKLGREDDHRPSANRDAVSLPQGLEAIPPKGLDTSTDGELAAFYRGELPASVKLVQHRHFHMRDIPSPAPDVGRQRDGLRLFILEGERGSGKTSFLFQVAWELATAGEPTYRMADPSPTAWRALARLSGTQRRVAVADKLCREDWDWLAEHASIPLTVVTTASGDPPPHNLANLTEFIRVPAPDPSEKAKLRDRIKIALPVHEGWTPEQAQVVSEPRSKVIQLVSWILAKGSRRWVESELANVTDSLRGVCAHVFLAGRFGMAVPASLLEAMDGDAGQPHLHPKTRHLVVADERPGHVVAVHSSVAQIGANYLESQGGKNAAGLARAALKHIDPSSADHLHYAIDLHRALRNSLPEALTAEVQSLFRTLGKGARTITTLARFRAEALQEKDGEATLDLEAAILATVPHSTDELVLLLRLAAKGSSQDALRAAIGYARAWLEANPSDSTVWSEALKATRINPGLVDQRQWAFWGLLGCIRDAPFGVTELLALHEAAAATTNAARHALGEFAVAQVTRLPLGSFELLPQLSDGWRARQVCQAATARIRNDQVTGNDVVAILRMSQSLNLSVQRDVFDAADAWLSRNPGSVAARQWWVKYVEDLPPELGRHRSRVRRETYEWLQQHPRAASVWTVHIAALHRRGFSAAANARTVEALAANPDNAQLKDAVARMKLMESDASLARAAFEQNRKDNKLARVFATRVGSKQGRPATDAEAAESTFRLLLDGRTYWWMTASQTTGIVRNFAEHLAYSGKPQQALDMLDTYLGMQTPPSTLPQIAPEQRYLLTAMRGEVNGILAKTTPGAYSRAVRDWREAIRRNDEVEGNGIGWRTSLAQLLLNHSYPKAAVDALEPALAEYRQRQDLVGKQPLLLAVLAIALGTTGRPEDMERAKVLRKEAEETGTFRDLIRSQLDQIA